MRMRSSARGLIMVGTSATVAAALSWAVAAGSASSSAAIRHAPDSTTVEWLSSSADRTTLDHIQATTDVSDTAWLAAGLLLTPIYFEVDLPLIER